MSKAFTSEETSESALVKPRAPLSAGVPNYVTERGLARLRDELAALARERAEPGTPELAALAQRRAELEARIASAELVVPPERGDVVRFGARVRVGGAEGERTYRIVGVDEANAAQHRIAFTSPLARALIGRAAGDTVRLRAPRGDEELEIVAVDYEADED
jgi:transcription elongation factor GreB